MSSGREMAADYRTTLSELTCNNKTQINMLTILAEDYKDFAPFIVNVIEEELLTSPPQRKIVILYVIDSIVKNIPKVGDYRAHFSKNIAKIFKHVFEESEERTRASLYKLRQTWADIFPRGKLYDLDVRISMIDSAWPVASISRPSAVTAAATNQTVHVNPKFLNQNEVNKRVVVKNDSVLEKTVTAKRVAEKAPTANEVTRRVAPKAEPISEQPSAGKRLANKAASAKAVVVKVEPAVEKVVAAAKRPSSEAVTSKRLGDEATAAKRPSLGDKTAPVKEVPKRVVVVKTEPVSENSTAAKRHGDKATPASEVAKEVATTKIEPIPEKSTTPKRPIDETAESKLPGDEAATAKSETTPPKSPSDKTTAKRLSDETAAIKPPASEKAAASAKRPVDETSWRRSDNNKTSWRRNGDDEMLAAKRRRGNGNSEFMMKPPPNTTVPGPLFTLPQPTYHPVPMLQPPPTVLTSSGFFSHPPPLVTNGGPPPIVVTNGGPPSMLVPPLMPSTATISNETPRLLGMPANNRVFVDGKAYDVIFLCDVPVIVRNGLPHRVSFSGPPRDIIIDGVLHKLAFGEAKTVIIDGEPHVLRFGAPSRELYMGNFPFRGVFGGPPIVATINGRRHEIRLLGAPPEAKIEQDPSYELARYMDPSQTNSALSSMASQSTPPMRQEPPKKENSVSNLEVSTLLKKLQHSGILSALASHKKQASDAAKPPQPSPTASTSADIRNSNSPPIPSNQRLDNIERRTAPMSTLDQFSMRSLVVRYDSVIEALHKDRVECPSCGIAIKELYGEAYHQHTAWHMRVLKGDKYTRSRPWFMSEEWFTFSETELANRVIAAEGDKGTDDQVASSSGVTSGDALSGDADEKDCCVCNEKFEEYFDEDDDAWKLRDCVIEDGKAFHRYCKTDAAFLDQSMPRTNNANPAVNSEADDGIGSGFEETVNRDEQQPKNLFGNLCDVNDTVELKAFTAGNM